jgi:uncharacterized protein (DUF1778 family)
MNSKTLWPRKTRLVNFRITEDDYLLWSEAAKKSSKSLAQLMREGMMLKISSGECRTENKNKIVTK